MSNTALPNPVLPGALYVIAWTNRDTQRHGNGTRQLPLNEANQLARELNEEYPDFEHVATLCAPTS